MYDVTCRLMCPDKHVYVNEGSLFKDFRVIDLVCGVYKRPKNDI